MNELSDRTNMESHIQQDSKFHELVRQRKIFAGVLSLIMITLYFGFIFTIAYGKAFLSTPLFENGVTTIALPMGGGVIFTAIILTGIYVWRANNKFDKLTHEILKEAQK